MTVAEQIVNDLEAALRSAAPQLAALDITEADLDAFLELMRPTWFAQLQAVPALAQEAPPNEEGLLRQALHRMPGATARWATVRRSGVSDAGLRKFLAYEWQGDGGRSIGFDVEGGSKPSFTPRGGQQLSGKRLLTLVRKVLGIGLPYDNHPPPPRPIRAEAYERHIVLALRAEGDEPKDARFQTQAFFVGEHKEKAGLVTRVRALAPGESLVDRGTVIERLKPIGSPADAAHAPDRYLDPDEWRTLAPLFDAAAANREAQEEEAQAQADAKQRGVEIDPIGTDWDRLQADYWPGLARVWDADEASAPPDLFDLLTPPYEAMPVLGGDERTILKVNGAHRTLADWLRDNGTRYEDLARILLLAPGQRIGLRDGTYERCQDSGHCPSDAYEASLVEAQAVRVERTAPAPEGAAMPAAPPPDDDAAAPAATPKETPAAPSSAPPPPPPRQSEVRMNSSGYVAGTTGMGGFEADYFTHSKAGAEAYARARSAGVGHGKAVLEAEAAANRAVAQDTLRRDLLGLSSGTLAGLIGKSKYEDIDAAQQALLAYYDAEHGAHAWQTWQEVWKDYQAHLKAVGSEAAAAAPATLHGVVPYVAGPAPAQAPAPKVDGTLPLAGDPTARYLEGLLIAMAPTLDRAAVIDATLGLHIAQLAEAGAAAQGLRPADVQGWLARHQAAVMARLTCLVGRCDPAPKVDPGRARELAMAADDAARAEAAYAQGDYTHAARLWHQAADIERLNHNDAVADALMQKVATAQWAAVVEPIPRRTAATPPPALARTPPTPTRTEIAEQLAEAVRDKGFRANVWMSRDHRQVRVYVEHPSTKRKIEYGSIEVTPAGTLVSNLSASGSDARTLGAVVRDFAPPAPAPGGG